MPERFAIYFAPALDSALSQRAEAWLARPDLHELTMSARRYGFHATLKAPMELRAGTDRATLAAALAAFAARTAPISLGRLTARLLDGFLALTPVPQPPEVTAFAAGVVEAFEDLRAPLSDGERARRLRAPLSPRQVELVDRYGYPYVLEEFLFHMTLTDRLPEAQQDRLVGEARSWLAPALAQPILLDRLALFYEPEPGAAFVRLDDYVLKDGK